MQTELARIDSWEEIAPDDRQDRERAPDKNDKENENTYSILQRPRQRIHVTLAQFFEAAA